MDVSLLCLTVAYKPRTVVEVPSSTKHVLLWVIAPVVYLNFNFQGYANNRLKNY